MDVLHDQWEGPLAPIAFSRLANRAGRRVGPERLVVGTAIVVASESEASRRPEYKQRRGEREPGGKPRGLTAKPGVRGIAENLRRIERRKIGAEAIVFALKCRPGGVNNEGGKSENYD